MFAVELAVGVGKRPDLGSVEFAVEFVVGEGRKPELGAVGYTAETDPMGYAEAFTLGKTPAEMEPVG